MLRRKKWARDVELKDRKGKKGKKMRFVQGLARRGDVRG